MKIFKSLKILTIISLFWGNFTYSQDDYSISLKSTIQDSKQVLESVEQILHKAFEPQRTLKLVLILPKLSSFEIMHNSQSYKIPSNSHLEIINCVFNKNPELTKVEIFSDEDITIIDDKDSFASKTIWLNPNELINKFERIDYYSLAD